MFVNSFMKRAKERQISSTTSIKTKCKNICERIGFLCGSVSMSSENNPTVKM